MVVEWSPNESYLKKFERLAYALVRKRPLQDEPYEMRENKRKNDWIEKSKGLAGPFAIGLLVAIPYVAENSSGPIIIFSLLLAAFDAVLAVWIFNDFEIRHGHCTGDLFLCIFSVIGEFPAFLVSWCSVSALSSALSACIRMCSKIMDAVTGNHIEEMVKNIFGTYTPLGAPLDFLSLGITIVPTLMVALGLEESTFLRFSLFILTTLTSLSILGSAISTNQLFNAVQNIPFIPDGNLYAKILSGASLASIGFLGIYRICKPDNLTLIQHKHFGEGLVLKRFSLTGCVIISLAFLLYFVESIVLNKVQAIDRLWDGTPILIWPLEADWRLLVSSLGIAALALSTFEFLIPMCILITNLSNEGLFYRNLRKEPTEDLTYWNIGTPLIFGAIAALQALLLDIKVLLGISTCNLMVIHIIVASSMLALRYSTSYPATFKRTCYRTRPRLRHCQEPSTPTLSLLNHHGQTRRLTVSFLKNGPKSGVDEISRASSSGVSDPNNDRSYLMDDIGSPHHMEPRGSTGSSGVSVTYETDTEDCENESGAEDATDIDAVVTEYQERLRVDSLIGYLPLNPTATTAKRVIFSTIALIICCLALAASLNRSPRGHITGIMLSVSSGLLIFLLLIVISRQPQKKREQRIKQSTIGPNNFNNTPYQTNTAYFLQYQIIPWVTAGAIFLHCCLFVQALDLSGTYFAFWLATGLIIYFSYGVKKSSAAPPPPILLPSASDGQLQSRPSVSTSTPMMTEMTMTGEAETPEPCVQILNFDRPIP